MPPGTELVIQQMVQKSVSEAVSTGRWEATALASIVLIITLLAIWLVKFWITQASAREAETLKQAISREESLNTRVDNLEVYIRTTLQETVKECTQALLQNSIAQTENVRVLATLTESLGTTRTCFATGDKQTELVHIIADRVAHKIRTQE